MTKPAQGKSLLRFGVFEADLRSGELRRNGHSLRLQEKPFQLLAILLETPGEVVSKEELQKRLWPDVTVDADAGLGEAVYKLRQALGDSVHAPRYIETVPKRGYRLVAAVEGPLEQTPPERHGRLPLYAGAALGAALLVVVGHRFLPQAETPPREPDRIVRRYALRPETGASFPVISPDGRRVTYYSYAPLRGNPSQSPRDAWVWELDRLKPRLLEGAQGYSESGPVTHGNYCAFVAGDELRVMPLNGGAQRRVCTLEGDLNAGHCWSRDGKSIVFADRAAGRLQLVSAGGGAPIPLFNEQEWQTLIEQAGPDVIPSVGNPYFLPMEDGRRVLVFRLGRNIEKLVLFAFDLDRRQTKMLGAGGARISYSSGHLVYSLRDQVWARAFSLERLEFTGEPFLVVEGVESTGVSASLDGTLVYRERVAYSRQLVWLDRRGGRLSVAGQARSNLGWLNLSPDETRVSFTASEADKYSVLVYDLASTRLTDVSRGVFGGFNAWSPDGESLAFSSTQQGGYAILQTRSDGASEAVPLLKNAGNQNKVITDWSPGGKHVIYRTAEQSGSMDLGYLELGSDGNWTSQPFVATEANEREGSFSPDGRYVAYQATLPSGATELVVRPFPDADRQWVISKSGAQLAGIAAARWTRAGRELIYAEPTGQGRTRLMAAPILESGANFVSGAPQPLFEVSSEIGGWDVTEDGERFLIAEPAGERPKPGFVVVENWYEEFRNK